MRIDRAAIAQVGPNTRRVVQVADGRATAQGAAALADGLQSFGRAATEIGLRARAQRDEASLARADMAATKKIGELEQRLAAEPEFEGLAQRGLAEVDRIYGEIGKTLKPRVRDVFGARLVQMRARAETRFTGLERERGVQAADAESLAAIEDAKLVVGDASARPEDRDAAEQAAIAVLEGYAARGFKSQEEVVRTRVDLRNTRLEADRRLQVQQAQNRIDLDPDSFESDLKAGAYSALSAVDAENLKGRAQNRREQLARERERDQRERASTYKTDLRAAMSDHIALAATGVSVTPLDTGEIERVLGRPAALRYMAGIAQVNAGQAISGAPLAALQPVDEVAGDNPYENVARKALNKAIAQTRSSREADPVQAAITERLLPSDNGAVAAGLAQGDISALVQQAPKRLAFFQSQGQEFSGQASVRLLTNGETEAFRSSFAQMNVNAQSSALAELSLALPAAAYRATVRQVFNSDPVRMQAAMAINDSAVDRQNARVLLEGRRLLNPSPEDGGKIAKVQLPRTGDLEASFARAAGDAFEAPGIAQQRGAAFEAFKAAYAAMANGSAELDRDVAEKAADVALGPRTRVNGYTVLVPSGVDADAYGDKLKVAMRDALRKAGWPAGNLGGVRPVPIKKGVYRLLYRNMVVRDDNGADVVMRVP